MATLLVMSMPAQARQRFWALAVAVPAWFAVTLQLYLSIEEEIRAGRGAGFGLLMYTGYFTLLSNILCAAVATTCALPATARGRFAVLARPWVVSSAALSIVMVGSIYFFVLRQQYDPQGINFLVNSTLHYIVPPLFVLLWWRFVPRGALEWADVWRMLAYPVAYLLYLLVRGEATGLYPYFFVDVPRIGYTSAIVNASVISGAFAVTAVALVVLNRRFGRA